MAASAWQLAPVDLVRFAERARKERTRIYDVLQTQQPPLPFDPSHSALIELLKFTTGQRKTLKRRDARHILADLFEWLEIYQPAPEQDRDYIKRLAEYTKGMGRKVQPTDVP